MGGCATLQRSVPTFDLSLGAPITRALFFAAAPKRWDEVLGGFALGIVFFCDFEKRFDYANADCSAYKFWSCKTIGSAASAAASFYILLRFGEVERLGRKYIVFGADTGFIKIFKLRGYALLIVICLVESSDWPRIFAMSFWFYSN